MNKMLLQILPAFERQGDGTTSEEHSTVLKELERSLHRYSAWSLDLHSKSGDCVSDCEEHNISVPAWAKRHIELMLFFQQEGAHYGADDPVAPFYAMKAASLHQIPPPDWAVNHFANVAVELDESLARRPDRRSMEISKRVGLLLGFDVKSRGENPRTLRRYEDEARTIFLEYLTHRAAGETVYGAIYAIEASHEGDDRPIKKKMIEDRLNRLARSLHLQNLGGLNRLADSVPQSRRSSPEEWAGNIFVVANRQAIIRSCRLTELQDRALAIQTRADAEGRRGFFDEECKELEMLFAAIDETQEDIARRTQPGKRARKRGQRPGRTGKVAG
jgi:hypothetical protein